MNNLIRLVKIATAMFQAWRLHDTDMMDELSLLAESVPKSKESLVQQDKRVEALLRKLLVWIREQPVDSNIITSLAVSKVGEIVILDPTLEKLLNNTFNDKYNEEDSRKLIFEIIKELRDNDVKNKFGYEFKSMVRPFLFDGEEDLTREDWIKINELISAKISDTDNNFDKAVVEKSSSNDPKSIAAVIDLLKIETSAEGIMKTGLVGLNEALYPDLGIRRGLFYIDQRFDQPW